MSSDGVGITGRWRLGAVVAAAALCLAAVGLGCQRTSYASEPGAQGSETAEKRAEARRELRVRMRRALGLVRRKFRAPPLFSESTVKAIAEHRARLGSWYGADDRTFRRENGDVEAYGAEVELVAADRSESSGKSDEYGAESFRSCEALFARIEAAAEPETYGVKPWKITVTPTSIRQGEENLFTRECTERFQCEYEADGQEILFDSLVGPILSYRVVDHSVPCGSDPFGTPRYHTVDLRDRERAALSALVEPESLREALLEDRWVREHVPKEKRQQVESLEELLELRYMKQFGFYSFYDWNAETGKVAMRIWKPHTTGKWTGSHAFLGVWVKPRPKFQKYFEAADDGRGFLMTGTGRPAF